MKPTNALRAAILAFFLILLSGSAQELDENCTVTLLNRSAQVNEGGWFGIANVPVERGLFRVRVYCTRDGVTTYGQSEFIEISAGEDRIPVGEITLGELDPLPISVAVTGPLSTLTNEGEVTQLEAIATLPDNSTRGVSTRAEGTLWTSSNDQIATVDNNGLVTAVSRGRVFVQALNEGVQGSFEIQILIPNDSDNDGLPDEFEIANGFDPNDPNDAEEDPDLDGLSTLEEFALGTNPLAEDSDGDGITDGEELNLGIDPLLADTDGDLLTDGEELSLGTDALLVDSDGDSIPDGLEVELGLNPAEVDATTTLVGRVVDENGDAVEGANAVVFDSLTAVSGVDGSFQIDFVPIAQGELTVSVFDIEAGMIATGGGGPLSPVVGGTTDFGDIVLVPNSGVVSGFVMSPTGDPVRDALVTVLSGEFVRETRTDSLGFYLVAGVTSGEVEVQARDFDTGLRARDGGNLAQNQSTVINLEIGAFGSIVGTVFERDNLTAVTAGVSVELTGRVRESVVTDSFGRYSFDFVPLGQFMVEASDASGNQGRTMGNLSTTSQVATSDIGFLGQGSVSGEVLDVLGEEFNGATVSLLSQSLFGGNQEVILSSDENDFLFENVFVGDFSLVAVSEFNNLAGFASGRIDTDGQLVDVDVTIAAAGTLKGIVFDADGVTPVSGVTVTLVPSGISTLTDEDGEYCFEFVPLGGYTIQVADLSNGNVGETTALLTEQGQTDVNDATLVGFGVVEVTVIDGGGDLVPGAQISIASGSQVLTLNTGMNGESRFEAVLAGDFSASATEVVSGLGGSATGLLGVGDEVAITVMLESSGDIGGQVLLVDGVTAGAGFRVEITGPGVRQEQTSGTDGGFVFSNLPLGSYQLDVFDSLGNRRSRSSDLVLASEGEVINELLILDGVGTAQILVTFADGSEFPNIGIDLVSNAEGAGPGNFGRTNADNQVTITGIPVGSFEVSSSFRSEGRQFFGTVTGEITAAGETVLVRLELDDSLIPVTQTLFDGNNFAYNVRENGQLQDGQRSIFQGDGGENRGFGVLDIEGETFLGSPLGGSEENGRELVIGQDGLSGLNVSRKIFVPFDGYFTRYLEIIENPLGVEQVINVRTRDHFRFIQKIRDGFNFDNEPRVITTSSGDAFVENADTWVTIDDDEDGDPFLDGNNLPTVAVVTNGEGGALSSDVLEFNVDFANRFGVLETEWNAVAVPAGGRVILMRFVSQQTGRLNASEGARRLSSLPPEALVGMSASERADILNWSVPANGVGSVTALPSFDGVVEGTVFAGDASTLIPRAQVSFVSNLPFYGRTFSTSADGDGRYSFNANLQAGAATRLIPRGAFVVSAVDPITNENSGDIAGTFGVESSTLQDVVFGTTGLITGVVRREAGEVVGGALVTVEGGGLIGSASVRTNTDGSYVATGLLPGIYTVTATLEIPSGTNLTTGGSVNVGAGQTMNRDLVLPATGSVSGLVTNGAGGPEVNVSVLLVGDGFSRRLTSDSGGRVLFEDVPVGSFELRVSEPQTNVEEVVTVAVTADSIVSADVQLVSVGTINLTARFVNGFPSVGSQVLLEDVTGAIRQVGLISDVGQIQVRVPVGAFTLRVSNPNNLDLVVEESGTIASQGEVISLEVSVPIDELPVVNLTSPGEGSSFEESSLVTLTASASDDIGVSSVRFSLNGNTFRSLSGPPFEASLRLPRFTGNEPLELSVTAFDTVGQASESSSVMITLTEDVAPPAIANFMLSPSFNADGYLEGETITLDVLVGDSGTGVDRVEFLANGSVFATDTTNPFRWSYTVPLDAIDAGLSTITLSVEAFDEAGNVSSSSQEINVLRDNPPTVAITSPSDGDEVVEGTLLSIVADASDDVGVEVVNLVVDGELVEQDNFAPFSFEYRVPSGEDQSSFSLEVVAQDTIGREVRDVVNLVRRDDLVPPTVSFVVPTDGSIITLGDSDVALVIDTSGSTSGGAGADVNGDGFSDNILTTEIVAAQQLLEFLDPVTTQVTVIDFSSTTIVEQELTNNFELANAALERILGRGPGGGTDFDEAMEAATTELVGLRARRDATAVQLFFSDGSSSTPSVEIERASLGGVVVNTFAVGSGASQGVLQTIADGTGGVLTPVVNAGDLVEILPNIVLFGINQLPVVANANDDVGVSEVEFSISDGGAFQNSLFVAEEPFQGLFGLPELEDALTLDLEVVARDFGDNDSESDVISVRVLPAENGPQINGFSSELARPGERVTIFGQFFDPVFANNTVDFNGLPATIVEGTKISLEVEIPSAAVSGPVTVTVGEAVSTPVNYEFASVGTVELEVDLPDGSPAEGAVVSFTDLVNTGIPVQAGTLDAEGRLSIPNLTGSYLISVQIPGFLGVFTIGDLVSSDNAVDTQLLEIAPLASVRVLVNNSEDGLALPNAIVEARHTEGNETVVGITDENGEFLFDNVAGGLVFFEVNATDFRGTSLSLFILDGNYLGTTLELTASLSSSANLPDNFLEFGGERDLWTVPVRTGQDLEIIMMRDNSGGIELPSLNDTFLELYDSEGNFLTQNDDFNGLNSQINWTATEDDELVIVARAFSSFFPSGDTGLYDLSVSIEGGARFLPTPFSGGTVNVTVMDGETFLPVRNRVVEYFAFFDPEQRDFEVSDIDGRATFENVQFGVGFGGLGEFEIAVYDDNDEGIIACFFGNVATAMDTVEATLFTRPVLSDVFATALNVPEAEFTPEALDNNQPDLSIRQIDGNLCLLVEPIAEGEMLMLEQSADGEVWKPWFAFYEVPEVSEVLVTRSMLVYPNGLIRARVSEDDRVPEAIPVK